MKRSSGLIEGVGVSPGIAIGKAFLVEQGRIPISHHTLEDEPSVEQECRRFQDAVNKAHEDFERIKGRVFRIRRNMSGSSRSTR